MSQLHSQQDSVPSRCFVLQQATMADLQQQVQRQNNTETLHFTLSAETFTTALYQM